jgi:hypothetical protein
MVNFFTERLAEPEKQKQSIIPFSLARNTTILPHSRLLPVLHKSPCILVHKLYLLPFLVPYEQAHMGARATVTAFLPLCP